MEYEEIVIKIPKKVYKAICNKNALGCVFVHIDDIKNIIRNGTPLPEGHGRLIDEKDLSLMTVHMIDGILVCDAPTIIEAESEEDK